MMKSFFKKLSLVMALALVVSSMAPAASAFAAELVIAGQEEKKADAKEEYSVAVGEEVDLKFYGAAAGWQDLYKWESSDETIAKPLVNEKGEQDGRFEGLKDGEVEITLTIGEQKATVKLVVGEGVVVDDKSFEVRQKTANTVEITFADAKYATKNITVEKLGKTTTGTVTEIVWPVNKVELKDNVATVSVWVDFGDGDYRFTANEVEVDKTLKIGLPAFAVVTYKDTYAYSVGGAIEPSVVVYDETGVELTGYTNWYYELVNTDADAYVESDGTLYLWNVGAVANIKATLTYFVGTETITLPVPVKVTCVAPEPYTVNTYLEKYAIVAPNTAEKDIVWGKTDVIINDGTYNVVGILKDSKDKELKLNALDGYYVTYKSSNPTVALVDENDGYVLGVTTGSAYVLVSLFKGDADDNVADAPMGVIAAVPVVVKEARKATFLTLDKTVDTLLTSGDFTTSKVTATVKDQHQGTVNDTIASVYAKVDDIPYSNTTVYETVTVEKEDGTTEEVKIYHVEVSGNTFTIDAKKFAGVKANSITFKVKMTSGLEATYVLNLKSLPELVNQTYALKVSGAKVFENETAKVEVVSAWAGNNLYQTSFYWGKPADAVIATGQLYVTITAPNGQDVTPTITGTATALTFDAIKSTSTATAGAIEPMAAGKYIVKLNQVTQCVKSDDKVIVQTTECDTKTFEITNNLPGVSEFKVLTNKYTSLANPIDETTVSFKIGETAWDGKNYAVTVTANDKKELDGSVYVYGFTVTVPYGTAGAYYTIYVPVNELFTK